MNSYDSKYDGYDEGDLSFDEIQDLLEQGKTHWSTIHQAYLDGIKFSYSTNLDQWDDQAVASRKAMGRPCETYNIINGLVTPIISLVQQNPPAINISPASGKATKSIARQLSGLIRKIEHESNAQMSYCTGLDGAVRGGLAVYKIVTKMDDLDEDVQFIPTVLPDPTTAYIDPCAVKADFSDAEWVITSKTISEKTYRREYPKGQAAPADNKIEIFELWIKKLSKVTEYDALQNKDITKKELKIYQYIFDEVEILECIKNYPGRYLPFAVATGSKYTANGVTHFQSLTEMVRGVQREINWCKSEAIATVACAPKNLFYGDKDALDKSDLVAWSEAATSPRVFLGHKPGKEIKIMPQVEPPVAYLQQADKGIDMARIITGIYPDPAQQENGLSPLSGKAINAQQAGQSLATFAYVNSNNFAIKRIGEILVDLIRAYWNDNRVRISMGVDGSFKSVSMGDTTVSGVDNFDLEDDQNYIVSISVGPSYANQKEALIAQIMDLCKANPEAMALCMDWIINNINLPGSEELAERFKLTLPKNIQDYLASKDGMEGEPEEQLQTAIMNLQKLSQELKVKSDMVDQLTQALDNETQLLESKEHELALKKSMNDDNNQVKILIAQMDQKFKEQQLELDTLKAILANQQMQDAQDQKIIEKTLDHAHKVDLQVTKIPVDNDLGNAE